MHLQISIQLEDRIDAFVQLGRFLGQFGSVPPLRNDADLNTNSLFDTMRSQLELAKVSNGWFTEDNLAFCCRYWSDSLVNSNLKKWIEPYNLEGVNSKVVGVVMAGNIPLVGFHDFIAVLLSGSLVKVKLSSSDAVLLPTIANFLNEQHPWFGEAIEFVDGKLTEFDAVIATGSNNTARYFDYYFGKYPNIIRKNRNGLALLTGNETSEQLIGLSHDIFRYFGLGCRNVSKIFVPVGYDFDQFFNAMFTWKDIIGNHKYMNNYDYNKAVYLMSDIPLLDNEFMLLKEDQAYAAPISVVHYEYYDSVEHIKARLNSDRDAIQCVVSDTGFVGEVAFGKTQWPELWDYADGADTLDFLLKLS